MLSFIENCRDVTFLNWLFTFMLPLISAYGNAPELKALQTNRIKCTFFKVDFTNVSFKKMHFARNIQCSNLEVCWFSLKIVGMSRFQTGFWPLCYRLYLHTATRKIRRPRAFGVAHPTKSHWKTVLVFISSCAAVKTARKFFETEFPRLRRRFFTFSAPKTQQFFAEKIKNRARSALRTSMTPCNRICICSCHSLLLKMRASLSANKFCICGIHFSNFWRRKRSNFPR